MRTSNLNPVLADNALSSHLVLPFTVVARLSIPFATLTSVKGKGKATLLQARLWPRGDRDIALLFQDLDAKRG